MIRIQFLPEDRIQSISTRFRNYGSTCSCCSCIRSCCRSTCSACQTQPSPQRSSQPWAIRYVQHIMLLKKLPHYMGRLVLTIWSDIHPLLESCHQYHVLDRTNIRFEWIFCMLKYPVGYKIICLYWISGRTDTFFLQLFGWAKEYNEKFNVSIEKKRVHIQIC